MDTTLFTSEFSELQTKNICSVSLLRERDMVQAIGLFFFMLCAAVFSHSIATNSQFLLHDYKFCVTFKCLRLKSWHQMVKPLQVGA